MKKEPLISRISSFRKWRNYIAIPLILLGVISLALPILPGLAIIFIGVVLINPDLADRVRNRIMDIYHSLRSSLN